MPDKTGVKTYPKAVAVKLIMLRIAELAQRSRMPVAAARIVAVLLLGMLGVAACSVPSQPSAAGSLDQASLDAWVESYVQRHGLPGVAVAVVKDGELVETAAAGGGSEPITDRTPLAIGSVSKMFTAFAVLQLVDAGKIDLDDRVRQLWPEFAVGDARVDEITVRHLLSHTSGLPNPTLVAPADTLAESVARLADMQLQSDPGTAYAYSNPGYWAAARLVEVVSGESFSDYLTRHTFAPAGMNETHNVETPSTETVGMDHGHVTAYGLAIPLREMAGTKTGAGGIVSTAHDMALWIGVQQRGGVTADGTRLLSSELVTEAQTRQPNAGTYGLGWQYTSTADPERVGHDGSLTRYSSRLDLVPSSGYGVVVLLDSYTPTYQHPFAISTGVVDLTEGRIPDPGPPVATIIDGALGLLTVGTIVFAALGVRRSAQWVKRRHTFPAWRFGLRLLPQMIMPIAAGTVFLVLPLINNNTATPLDALGLWPAAMILVFVTGVAGLVLTVVRLRQRVRPVS